MFQKMMILNLDIKSTKESKENNNNIEKEQLLEQNQAKGILLYL